ncbi:MAG: hypothetical protein JXQ93_04845 [Flavobacteriaceae bacterium]
MKSPNRKEVEYFVNDLLDIFIIIEENGKPILNTLQKFSNSINKEILDFVYRYNDRFPQLNQLPSFFRKLSHNDYFIFLPNIELDQLELFKLKEYYETIKEGKEYVNPSNDLLEKYIDLLKKYKINFIGSKRISIGERNKSKRVCRFCKKKNGETTFKNKAHAISEALGNKTVMLFDECDKCNKFFSETIEPDMVQSLSLFRTFFGVKGKGGNKKIKGKNFYLKNDGKINLVFNSLNDRPDPLSKNYNLKLNLDQPINFQNIYKTLCKYFLSVIDGNELAHFRKTIDWVKGDLEIESLPKIGELISYDFFTLQPKLTYYIRKDKRCTRHPYAIGEFRFTCKIMIFIVPLSDYDKKNFLKESDYKYFWKTFKHYHKYKDCVFSDYSNNDAKDFSINLNFTKDEKEIK